MKTIHNNIPFIFNGKEVHFTVDVYTRGGSDSPNLWIIKYNGKTYLPFQQRKLGISCTFTGLFKITYGPHIEKLVPIGKSLFVKLFPKPSDFWGGTVILGGDSES